MAIYHQSRSRQRLYWWDAINYTALVTDQSNIWFDGLCTIIWCNVLTVHAIELLSTLTHMSSFIRSSVRSWCARPWTWSRRSPKNSTMKSSGRNSAPTLSWAWLRITPTEPAWLSCSASRPPTTKPHRLVWSSTWRGWRRSKTRSTSWLEPAGRRCLSVFTPNWTACEDTPFPY